MLFEVRSYLLEQLVQRFQTELNKQHKRVVENTVLVYLEDILKEQSEVMVIHDDELVD